MVIAVITSLVLILSFLLGHRLGSKNENEKLIENSGEFLVRSLLTEYCAKSTAYLLNNITLPHKNGTTQIDHILFTQNGILVIETKNYSGWLFAHEYQKTWTQVKFKFKRKFQNPIRQNKMHISAVQNLLDFMPNVQIQSLVVFAGSAKFKTEIPSGVIYIDKLLEYVDNIRLGSITENRMQFCIGRLEYERFSITEQTDIDHRAYLNNKFNN